MPSADSRSSTVDVRPAVAGDLAFLLRVYSATRLEEVSSLGWTPEQQNAFLKMQFELRRRAYDAAYPGAEPSVVLEGGIAVGSILVFRSDSQIRLVDIALLPECRSRGIGTKLIADLLAEAARARLPLRLNVLSASPAALLYKRLGFHVRAENYPYTEMEYNGAGDPHAGEVQQQNLL